MADDERRAEIEAMADAIRGRVSFHEARTLAEMAYAALDRVHDARDEHFHQHDHGCRPPCECDCAGCRTGRCSLVRDARGDELRSPETLGLPTKRECGVTTQDLGEPLDARGDAEAVEASARRWCKHEEA